MGFQVGHKKVPGSGIKKGQKHKRLTATELYQKLGFDPLKELIKLLPELPLKQRAAVLKDLAVFERPTLKALEVDSRNLNVNTNADTTPLVRLILPANGKELNGHYISEEEAARLSSGATGHKGDRLHAKPMEYVNARITDDFRAKELEQAPAQPIEEAEESHIYAGDTVIQNGYEYRWNESTQKYE